MGLAKRIIPCLDVAKGRVVKGINFVNLRDAGDPVEVARRYDQQGADELAFLDIQASVESRALLYDMVEAVADQVFIPLTVGGGVTHVDDIRALLNEHDFELFQKNSRAALYEPLVGAAAHALATVLDRIRHGSLPTSIERDACAQHAALLAANLAAQPARWPEFRARLLESAAGDPKALILAALALGWSEKWRST